MEQDAVTFPHTRLFKNESFTSFVLLIKNLFTLPLFYIPLFLKIAASLFFASHFATELFVPFISYFVAHPFENPYEHFISLGKSEMFPYPFGMLIITSVPFFIANFFSSSYHVAVTSVDIVLLRLPLLLADIGILVVLLMWFKRFEKSLLLLYWCSPVLFYITYIHGQLDVLPVFFLFAFLYFLTKERDILAFMLLGIALTLKTGMALVIPFVLVYLLKERKKLTEIVNAMVVMISVFVLVNIGVLFSHGFYQMVFKTKEQFKVFDLVVPFGSSVTFFVTPSVILILLLYFAKQKRYSRNVFMTVLGLSFFVLIICIPPQQGWYFWVIPFAVYFYAQRPMRSWLPYVFLTVAYLMYFALTPDSSFWTVLHQQHTNSFSLLYWLENATGLQSHSITSLAFTVLETALLVVVYSMYRQGVQVYTKQKLYHNPFMIGVAGDSGSGKSTISELLMNIFTSKNTTLIEGDAMHKWERGNENWQTYTHLDPHANELHQDIHTVYSLKHGESIKRRTYDHTTGMFTAPLVHKAKRIVVFEGLHTFFLGKVRSAFDMKIYVAPEDQLRLHWKIIRDTKKRGYTKEQTLAILEQRKDDSEQFIRVQEKHSDIIISLRNNTSLGSSVGDEDVSLFLSLFITCTNDIHLEPLFAALSHYFTIDFIIHDDKQRVKFSGDITNTQVENIAHELLPELDDLLLSKPDWKSGYDGIIQLFVTYCIIKQVSFSQYE